MKITVKIDNRSFDIELGDLHTRPVVALVDGERFEVWPQTGGPAPAQRGADALAAIEGGAPPQGDTAPVVKAPIPGVIFSIAVQPGDRVIYGQELCQLEAMKMKNVIRSPFAGQIKTVKVAVGQHVPHGEVLVEYIS